MQVALSLVVLLVLFSLSSVQSSASIPAKLLTVTPRSPSIYRQTLLSPAITKSIKRGALFRVCADLSGGTVFENVKSYITLNSRGTKSISFKEAVKGICVDKETGKVNPFALYRGTPTRLLEASGIGFLFYFSSSQTVRILSFSSIPIPKPLAKAVGGVMGGIAQSIVMTPSSIIQTLSIKHGLPVSRTIANVYREKGLPGFYTSFSTLCLRQSSNWASRSMFTELLRVSNGGIAAELAAGIGGGCLAMWNTPLEVVRVKLQSEEDDRPQRSSPSGALSAKKSYSKAFTEIYNDGGIAALYRGVGARTFQSIVSAPNPELNPTQTPSLSNPLPSLPSLHSLRSLEQWQTVWMVVLPNVMGP
jgi:hypothetical protein